MFHLIRVKLIIEEIEREETALREDLYSADRKFAEYYNVCKLALCGFMIYVLYPCFLLVSGTVIYFFWNKYSVLIVG